MRTHGVPAGEHAPRGKAEKKVVMALARCAVRIYQCVAGRRVVEFSLCGCGGRSCLVRLDYATALPGGIPHGSDTNF